METRFYRAREADDVWGGAAIVLYEPALTSGERLAQSVWMVPGTANLGE